VIIISKTKLKVEDKRKLFFDCGGRCSRCCNALDYDVFSRKTIESQEYAHIIGEKKDGPRGNNQSKIYAGDINNIIVLCPTCHTIIDKNLAYYTIDRLTIMKKKHEEKVIRFLDALKNTEALAVKYTSPIGDVIPVVDENKMDDAIRESGYYSSRVPVDLNPNNTVLSDGTQEFWDAEWTQLSANFNSKIVVLQERGSLAPILLFALAPQPLLIRLGTLLRDIADVRVFQKRREPDTWTWDKSEKDQIFNVLPPTEKHETVAVKLSLSDVVNDDRVHAVLGRRVSIWTITQSTPRMDFLCHPNQLEQLRKAYRDFFQQVRAFHGQNVVLHVFPVAPNSAAVEFGRTWMPKVDARLILYDHIRPQDRFTFAYMVGG